MPSGNCFLCKKYGFLEEHHIFGGANRKKSTKYRLTVYLCPECHRTGKKSAHRNKEVREMIQKYGERKFIIEQNADVSRFIAEFGKNYL